MSNNMCKLHKSVSRRVVTAVLVAISFAFVVLTPCTAHMYSSNNNTNNNDKKKAGDLSDDSNTINVNAIIDYSVTTTTQNEQNYSESNNIYESNWSHYVPDVCTHGKVIYSSSFLNRINSIKFFADAEFSSPFYHLQVHWFISPFGFITPMHQAMCPMFCQDRLVETLNGFYNFDYLPSFLEKEYTMPHGGGHYPLIGLFVNNLSTSADNKRNSEGKVCIIHGTSKEDDEDKREYIIVEYNNLYSITNDYSGSLTAQVQLYSDGEIIMRYRSVPSLTAPESLENGKGKLKHDKFTKVMPASTGVVLSSSTRHVLPVPDSNNQIVAIRLSPVRDIACSSLTTPLNCLNAKSCA